MGIHGDSWAHLQPPRRSTGRLYRMIKNEFKNILNQVFLAVKKLNSDDASDVSLHSVIGM